jgi:predicted DNA-binding transcriptional regulator AlpA
LSRGPLLSCHEIVDEFGFSRATIYRRVAAGVFPRPVKIGGSTRWLRREIDAWLEGLASKAA